ncbi:MAG: hypothetical protein ISN29_09640 [Gammaproteobacteria bacterium AqS3]|nr:hypothetical protein [Gammaproteobacteria bacterium AqS3]
MNIITKSIVYGAILAITMIGGLIGFVEILLWMKAFLPKWALGWILGSTIGTIAFAVVFYGYFNDIEADRKRKEESDAI